MDKLTNIYVNLGLLRLGYLTVMIVLLMHITGKAF